MQSIGVQSSHKEVTGKEEKKGGWAHVKKRLLVHSEFQFYDACNTACCCSPNPLDSRPLLGEKHVGNAKASGIELEEHKPHGEPWEILLKASSPCLSSLPC